jgi:hypothetical protein
MILTKETICRCFSNSLIPDNCIRNPLTVASELIEVNKNPPTLIEGFSFYFRLDELHDSVALKSKIELYNELEKTHSLVGKLYFKGQTFQIKIKIENNKNNTYEFKTITNLNKKSCKMDIEVIHCYIHCFLKLKQVLAKPFLE